MCCDSDQSLLTCLIRARQDLAQMLFNGTLFGSFRVFCVCIKTKWKGFKKILHSSNKCSPSFSSSSFHQLFSHLVIHNLESFPSHQPRTITPVCPPSTSPTCNFLTGFDYYTKKKERKNNCCEHF